MAVLKEHELARSPAVGESASAGGWGRALATLIAALRPAPAPPAVVAAPEPDKPAAALPGAFGVTSAWPAAPGPAVVIVQDVFAQLQLIGEWPRHNAVDSGTTIVEPVDVRAGRRLAATAVMVRVPEDPKKPEGATVIVCPTRPETLAEVAVATIEEYSLARCVASEGWGGDLEGRTEAAVVIAQCVRNASARARPLSKRPISDKLLASGFALARGLYGEQRGRYAATTRDATVWHLLVCRAVLAGTVPDLAMGGTAFLDPHVWRAGAKQGGRKLEALGAVLARWCGPYGLEWTGDVPGIDHHHLLVFRPQKDAKRRALSLAELLALPGVVTAD